jgi:DnaJ-class molecular chaperone
MTNKTCNTCGGSGTVITNEWMGDAYLPTVKTCGSCNGTGKQR